jgi:hypothetical protein
VTLERVRRRLGGQTLSEDSLGVRAHAACDGFVLERARPVRRVPDVDQLREACGLTASCPPEKHRQLARLNARRRLKVPQARTDPRPRPATSLRLSRCARKDLAPQQELRFPELLASRALRVGGVRAQGRVLVQGQWKPT